MLFKPYTVTFFGHREVHDVIHVEQQLEKIIEDIVRAGKRRFSRRQERRVRYAGVLVRPQGEGLSGQ